MAIVHFVNSKRENAVPCGYGWRPVLRRRAAQETTWEDGQLVSGINCQPQSVYDDFLNTKLLYHKDGGVMFCMVQSFREARRPIPGRPTKPRGGWRNTRFGGEVLVCTHVDREYIHSHCVINSVNFDTGKSCTWRRNKIQELMRRNDMICQEMGLPVLSRPRSRRAA